MTHLHENAQSQRVLHRLVLVTVAESHCLNLLILSPDALLWPGLTQQTQILENQLDNSVRMNCENEERFWVLDSRQKSKCLCRILCT